MNCLSNALHNPHLLAGAVVIRFAVNLATILWAAVVLIKTDALTSFAGYYWMLQIASENTWALALCATALYQMYRLLARSRPHKYSPGYALISLFWMYVWWSIVVNPGPLWPAAFACVTTISVLALWAFISNPIKVDYADSGH